MYVFPTAVTSVNVANISCSRSRMSLIYNTNNNTTTLPCSTPALISLHSEKLGSVYFWIIFLTDKILKIENVVVERTYPFPNKSHQKFEQHYGNAWGDFSDLEIIMTSATVHKLEKIRVSHFNGAFKKLSSFTIAFLDNWSKPIWIISGQISFGEKCMMILMSCFCPVLEIVSIIFKYSNSIWVFDWRIL